MERGRDKFQRVKPVFNIMVAMCSLFPTKVRKKMFDHFRRTTGIKGIALRYVLLRSLALKCGDNISVHPNCFILHPEGLKLGDNVSIQPMCYIDATGGVSIGNDVSIAHGTTIMSTEHNFSELDIPIKDQGVRKMRTLILNNVWIGAKATILAGVTVAEGNVIAAGAVVNKDTAPFSVNGGVPARILRMRA